MTCTQLHTWRVARHMTLDELAPLLGTTPASISRWENGQRPIPAHIPILLFLLSVKKNERKVRLFINFPLTQ